MLPIMNSYSQAFKTRVEAFLESTGLKPTEFGRQAIGDPSFVLSLRRGRSPTLATADKVEAFMTRVESAEAKRSNRK